MQTPDERPVFHPWGFLGRGYVLGSWTELGRLRRARRWALAIGVLAVWAVAVKVGVRAAEALAGSLFAIELLGSWWIGRGRVRTERRPTLREEAERRARTERPATLWLHLVLAMGATVACIAWTVASHFAVVAMIGAVFFGFGAFQATWSVRLRGDLESPGSARG